MADETKEARTPEEKRLWLEATTDTDSETLRKREIEERTLLNSWGTPVLAPNYWTYDDIGQWNEMTKNKDVENMLGDDVEIVSTLDFVTEATKVINGDEPLDYINSLDYMTLPHRIESMEQLVAEEKEHRRSAYEYFQNEVRKQVIDKGVEQTQANDGMGEAAMEAERAAQENPRPDYLDEQGNPHWFDEEEETEILSDEEIERLKEKEREEKHAKNLLSDISNVLDEGTVYSARNNNENIELRRGQKRTGLIHIITRRYEEKVLNKKVNMPPEQAMKEISALSYLIADSLDKDELKQTPKGNWEINQNGIQSIITKDKNGKFVLTGYEFNDNIEVARNSINAVIAQYGDTPEFLGVYAQVGAALTSYGYNITSQNSPVNEQSNSSLEQSTLEKAADLLKNMNFNSENYKDLLEVINKISSMNGLENLEVPKEPESIEKVAQAGQGENENAPGKSFDPKAPIVYGETVLPAFAVMADGKLQSVENAVVAGYDKSSQVYTIDNGSEKMRLPKSTLETLLSDKMEQEQTQARLAEGKTIVFEDKDRGVKGTVIPEFAMYTQKGLESFKDFVTTGFNAAENTYTLSNGDSTMTVTAERFKEITASERFENHFDENSPAWKKLCETQYNDFFRQRENTAYNFRHNLSAYCRKEANSPCDALHLAKQIIQQMPSGEQKKTERLLKNMSHENESMNELIARLYHESVKEMPLNEDYIKKYQPDKVIARPFYDTISDSGKKVEDDPSLVKGSSDRNLRIGDTLKNVDVQVGKLFGKGNDVMHFDELKVVSASKEGNSITLMDSNKSYFKLPRDTVLQAHKEQQLKEMKQEQRHSRANSISFSYA